MDLAGVRGRGAARLPRGQQRRHAVAVGARADCLARRAWVLLIALCACAPPTVLHLNLFTVTDEALADEAALSAAVGTAQALLGPAGLRLRVDRRLRLSGTPWSAIDVVSDPGEPPRGPAAQLCAHGAALVGRDGLDVFVVDRLPLGYAGFVQGSSGAFRCGPGGLPRRLRALRPTCGARAGAGPRAGPLPRAASRPHHHLRRGRPRRPDRRHRARHRQSDGARRAPYSGTGRRADAQPPAQALLSPLLVGAAIDRAVVDPPHGTRSIVFRSRVESPRRQALGRPCWSAVVREAAQA